MAAYDTPRLSLATPRTTPSEIEQVEGLAMAPSASMLDAVIDQLVERVVERVAALIDGCPAVDDHGHDGLDSRHAADYLGIHRDTLRRLAAERAIPSEQDGPNCKLYFRRLDLDAWRPSGGRSRHLAMTLGRAA